MPASLTGWTLSVGPMVPPAVHPGDSATSNVTIASINNPQTRSFFQGVVTPTCTVADGNCTLAPTFAFVNGDIQIFVMTVSMAPSAPLQPGGYSGTFPITVTGKDNFGGGPSNGSQSVPLVVTKSSGGGYASAVTFAGLLLLWVIWRIRSRERVSQ